MSGCRRLRRDPRRAKLNWSVNADLADDRPSFLIQDEDESVVDPQLVHRSQLRSKTSNLDQAPCGPFSRLAAPCAGAYAGHPSRNSR
jgi:hypothetical protein